MTISFASVRAIIVKYEAGETSLGRLAEELQELCAREIAEQQATFERLRRRTAVTAGAYEDTPWFGILVRVQAARAAEIVASNEGAILRDSLKRVTADRQALARFLVREFDNSIEWPTKDEKDAVLSLARSLMDAEAAERAERRAQAAERRKARGR